jgi:hypothetical protein
VIESRFRELNAETESFSQSGKGGKNLRWLQKRTSPEELNLQGWC